MAEKPASTGYLRRWRIGLEPSDNPDLADLRETAEIHGASIAKNMTKTVRFFVTALAEDSPLQAKARALGVPIITSTEAATMMNDAVRTADLQAFEIQQQRDRWKAERLEYERFWIPQWRRSEDFAAPDQDPWYYDDDEP